MISIAIDGPAGAGKSSIARAIAKKLRIHYVDTGAMYRAVALKALRNGVSLDDEEAIASFLLQTTIDVAYGANQAQRLILDGEDVTDAIRDNDVAAASSDVARHASIREALVALQRDLAERCDVVMDGRDIGTVVLPTATLKVFLTASPEVRALRRLRQLRSRGQLEGRSFDTVLREIVERDAQDTQREHSPLTKADDSVLLDTSDLKPDEVVDAVLALLPSDISMQSR